MRKRENREKKAACKGVKSMRGKPEVYDELKKITTASLTPTALQGIDLMAQNLNVSRSEFLERIGRGSLRLEGIKLDELLKLNESRQH